MRKISTIHLRQSSTRSLAALWFCNALFSACSSQPNLQNGALGASSDVEPTEPAVEGGQSGVEGGCGPESVTTAPIADDANGLAVRPSQVFELVAGVHTTTLRWAAWSSVAQAAVSDVSVEVQPTRDATNWRSGCGVAQIETTARLKLRSSDGLLDIETDALLAASEAGRVRVSAKVPRSELAVWDERLQPLANLGEGDAYLLDLLFTEDTLEGTFKIQSGGGPNATCDLAAWPSEPHCELWQKQAALEEPLHGFDVRSVVDRLNVVGPVKSDWPDGTRTLNMLFALDSDFYCNIGSVRDLNGLPTDKLAVEVPLRVQLTTEDGVLDLSLRVPAQVSVDAMGMLDDLSVSAYGWALAEAVARFGVAAPDSAQIWLQLFANSSDSLGNLRINRITPKAAAQRGELSPACLNTSFVASKEEITRAEFTRLSSD